MHIKEHFQTITYHRRLVRQSCFRVGLYWQGLTHDLSKYSLTEFLVGAKYFQGDCSPNNAEKEEKGYSSSWLHHKGRNKHHFEYWIDYSMPGSKGPLLIGMKMPLRYVVEMFMDRIAACKVSEGRLYRCKPLAVSSEKQACTGGDAPRKPCFAQSLTANAGRGGGEKDLRLCKTAGTKGQNQPMEKMLWKKAGQTR